MKHRLFRLGAPLFAGALLAGCAHLPVDGDGLSFDERRAQLESLPGWEMRGRLAVNTGEGAFQGSFHWRKHDDTISLSIRGPFGAGILEVTGTQQNLLVRARGETWTLVDPETELSQLLGWWMPVGSLHAWLLGLPDRAFQARTELGPNQALQTLEQRFWELNYDSYQLSNGLLLPRRIGMSHGPMELRVSIDAWAAATTLTSALN